MITWLQYANSTSCSRRKNQTVAAAGEYIPGLDTRLSRAGYRTTSHVVRRTWTGAVLDHSFVRHRPQAVAANGEMSETSAVKSSVPRGSVLGPILFLLYRADAARIVETHGISFDDDSELYLHSKADEIALTLPRVVSCIDAIDRSLSSNRIKLNTYKKNPSLSYLVRGCSSSRSNMIVDIS